MTTAVVDKSATPVEDLCPGDWNIYRWYADTKHIRGQDYRDGAIQHVWVGLVHDPDSVIKLPIRKAKRIWVVDKTDATPRFLVDCAKTTVTAFLETLSTEPRWLTRLRFVRLLNVTEQIHVRRTRLKTGRT